MLFGQIDLDTKFCVLSLIAVVNIMCVLKLYEKKEKNKEIIWGGVFTYL